MPEEGIECLNPSDILSFKEIVTTAEAAALLGIKKIKLTGGEPLVRKGIPDLIGRIKGIKGIEEVTMTSNGILLKSMAKDLKKAGLDGINISLDTIDPRRFKRLTRFDKLNEVLAGIREVASLGIKTKLNCVPIHKFNEDEITKIAEFSGENILVRFIELMPIGLGKEFQLIPYQKVKKMLEDSYGVSQLNSQKHGNGPAVYYNFPGLSGSIGFITAMSHEFCRDCNRIRLTAEGDLKLCLHHMEGISLKPYLENHISKEKLAELLREVIYQKPAHHCFHEEKGQNVEWRNMVQIGG
jgi:cyclic pyranopterin phosphate synthase